MKELKKYMKERKEFKEALQSADINSYKEMLLHINNTISFDDHIALTVGLINNPSVMKQLLLMAQTQMIILQELKDLKTSIKLLSHHI